MEGGSSPDGLCYRAFQELFSIRDSRCESGRMSYAIKVSMLEIYNEQVRKRPLKHRLWRCFQRLPPSIMQVRDLLTPRSNPLHKPSL
jgi:hypothetical protein